MIGGWLSLLWLLWLQLSLSAKGLGSGIETNYPQGMSGTAGTSALSEKSTVRVPLNWDMYHTRTPDLVRSGLTNTLTSWISWNVHGWSTSGGILNRTLLLDSCEKNAQILFTAKTWDSCWTGPVFRCAARQKLHQVSLGDWRTEQMGGCDVTHTLTVVWLYNQWCFSFCTGREV